MITKCKLPFLKPLIKLKIALHFRSSMNRVPTHKTKYQYFSKCCEIVLKRQFYKNYLLSSSSVHAVKWIRAKLPWKWTHRMRSHLLCSPPGKRRSRPCRLPSGCSCWHRTRPSSPPPRSPDGTDRFRWRRGPGRSSHSGSDSGSSHHQCRPPRRRTRHPDTGPDPSSR